MRIVYAHRFLVIMTRKWCALILKRSIIVNMVRISMVSTVFGMPKSRAERIAYGSSL